MRSVVHMTKARRPHHFGLDRQGVAVLPGGALLPAPSGPHQQGVPYGSSPAANRDPHGFLATNRSPRGFLDKGDVMIHRPYLVAGPAGSDWRTRRLRLVVHLDDRSRKT